MNEFTTPEPDNTPVTTSLSDGVLRLTLNNPEKRNTLSEATLDALHQSLKQAEDKTNIRVVIIGSTGPVFCAGHDLKELTAGRNSPDQGVAYFTEIMQRCSSLMQRIIKLPKPVIADVRGTATAAGCQLVATCDLALATPDVHFATPGVNIGLFCSTPMVALSRNVSSKHAMEMLLTGETIGANRAAETGLINRVVPKDSIDEAINELALKIAAKSSMTLKIGKEAFYKQAEMPLSEAYEYASMVMVENMMKQDANEGIEAFLDKRPPNWQDK